ncbi:MAG: hypothetical protein MJE12_19795 [Alphaproteobacteria bacterium]|nr:hypothetical protein [Alphaproteobacteria bacterium]
MHTTRAFKTCDGKLFDSEQEAAQHEAFVKIQEWAEKRELNGKNSANWETIASAMIEDASELAYLFVSLAQSLPKNGEMPDLEQFVAMPDDRGTMWMSKNN